MGRGAWGKGIGFVTLDARAAAIVLDAAARNASYHRVDNKVVVVRRVADAARASTTSATTSSSVPILSMPGAS